MTTEDFIDELVRAPDGEARRVLLDTHFELLKVDTVAALKTRADKLERDDAHLALQIGEIAGQIADKIEIPEAHALALWIEANAYDFLAELDTAAHCYERAAEFFKASGKDLEAARTGIGLMSTLMKAGKFEQVLALAGDIRTQFRDHADWLSLAKTEMNLGVMHYQQGQYVQARDAFQSAVQNFQTLGDPFYAAMNQINQANSMIQLDDFLGAERLHEAARPVFEQAGQRAVAGSVEADLALLKYAHGNYTDAIRTFEQARDVFMDLSDRGNTAMVNLEESDLYLDLNLPKRALQLAEEAAAAFKEAGMAFELARAQMNQAVSLARLSLKDQAVELLQAVRGSFADQNNPSWMGHADLQLAEIFSQDLLKKNEALRLENQALEAYQQQGMNTKQAYASILKANLFADDGNWEKALEALEEARRPILVVSAPWLEARIELCAGRIAEGKGSLTEAISHFQSAAEKTENIASTVTAEEQRTAFVADKLAPYEALVSLLAKTDPATAFMWAERAKSRALVDLLAAGVRPRLHLKENEDNQRVERLQSLREELNWLYTRITHSAEPGGAGAPAAGPETIKKIEELEKQASELWQDLQSRHPERISLMRSLPISAADIQRLLPANIGLLEYFIARDQVGAFLLTHENIRAFPALITPAEILDALEELAFQFSIFQFGPDYYERNKATLVKGTEEILERLGRLLIEPLQEELEGLDSLVIIPHGPLHTLPFQALRLGGRYLIEQFSLSVDPSAAVFKYCQEKSAQRQGRQPFSGKALLAGVPDEQAACVTEEIEGLAKIFGETQVLLGEQATLNNFRQTASSSGLIHLAAHGIFRPEAPLLSSIHLFDGWLAVQDIYNLDLHAELVTLSACETGLGYDAGGDDLVGLVRGFLHAGARSLVVSLWMVEDESMARLMKSFYSFWLAGDSKAKALQKAQLDQLKIYGHPFYWAPLNLVGAES